jgi:hypothetical protein
MPSPTQMTDEELLARILEDAETAQIASTLGLEPADYAARVLHYIRNPNAQPQLDVMDPGAAKEAGLPSLAECHDFVEKLASGEIPLDEQEVSRFAGFDDNEKSAATLTGTARKKGPAAEPPMPPEPNDGSPSAGRKSRSGRG